MLKVNVDRTIECMEHVLLEIRDKIVLSRNIVDILTRRLKTILEGASVSAVRSTLVGRYRMMEAPYVGEISVISRLLTALLMMADVYDAYRAVGGKKIKYVKQVIEVVEFWKHV